jgi:hypothetical protein
MSVKILVWLSELHLKTAGHRALQHSKSELEIKETVLGSDHPEEKEIKVLVSV